MSNPLTEALPPVVRKYLYAAIFVAGLVLAAVQGSDGDWLAMVTYLIPSLTSALAASNTPSTVREAVEEEMKEQETGEDV